jgi:transposase InsO family protein
MGSRLRQRGEQRLVLAVVDDFTRESLCLVPDTSLSGARVARELDAVIARRGRPWRQIAAFDVSTISVTHQSGTKTTFLLYQSAGGAMTAG